MSAWTHPLCSSCWDTINPDRPPLQLEPVATHLEICCRCGLLTNSGIYWRADPATLMCRGDHAEGQGAAAAADIRIQLERLGTPIRKPFEPVARSDWLPTQPGTMLEFSTPYPWSGGCRTCRILARLNLWRLRGRHRTRRRHGEPAALSQGTR